MLDVPNIPDDPRGGPVPGPHVPLVGLGPLEIDCRRTGRVDRHRRQRDPVRPRDRREAAHLTVFQRTPIWVSPRYDEPFTAEQQELFERDPGEALKVRDAAFQAYEAANFGADSEMTKGLTDMAREYLARKVADPELRAKLTPSYPVGCKRPLQSRAWFPTFARPNVTLETPRSPSSPSTACAPPTASTTVRHRHLRHRLSRRRLPGAASTSTGPVDGDCATTGATAPRRTWARWCPATRTCSRCTAPTPTASPRSSTSSKPRPSSFAASSTTWPWPGCGSRRQRDVHDTYNVEIQRAMEGTVWLANCNNYYRHPNGKVVTQFPYSGTTFVECWPG